MDQQSFQTALEETVVNEPLDQISDSSTIKDSPQGSDNLSEKSAYISISDGEDEVHFKEPLGCQSSQNSDSITPGQTFSGDEEIAYLQEIDKLKSLIQSDEREIVALNRTSDDLERDLKQVHSRNQDTSLRFKDSEAETPRKSPVETIKGSLITSW